MKKSGFNKLIKGNVLKVNYSVENKNFYIDKKKKIK